MKKRSRQRREQGGCGLDSIITSKAMTAVSGVSGDSGVTVRYAPVPASRAKEAENCFDTYLLRHLASGHWRLPTPRQFSGAWRCNRADDDAGSVSS
jgi:hypothetical protein